MAGKKIKLNEEAIGEILVADTDSNQVLRLAILTVLRRKKKKRTNTTATTTTANNNNNNNKPQQK